MVDVDIVREAVRRSLPPGAVPDRIEIVPALPRTQSGKVDAGAASRLVEDRE